jgi:hypothetical protein
VICESEFACIKKRWRPHACCDCGAVESSYSNGNGDGDGDDRHEQRIRLLKLAFIHSRLYTSAYRSVTALKCDPANDKFLLRKWWYAIGPM